MEHLEDNKLRISIFSLEMNANMLMAKILSTYIFEHYNVRLSIKQLLSVQRGFRLNDDCYDIVRECIPWMKKVESILTIYDKSASANFIYSSLMKELNERGRFEESENRKIYIPDNPDLTHIVIIDHLGRLMPQQGSTLKAEMDLASKYLYSIKNRCNITPIVIQQMNRSIQSMDRRKEAMVIPLTSDAKDTNATIEDAESVLAIFSPDKAKLNTYKGYDIKELRDNFRSIHVLKTRYGMAGVEDAIYYDGKCNKWVEMPPADKINDYEKLKNPRWYLEEDTNSLQTIQKPKFIL